MCDKPGCPYKEEERKMSAKEQSKDDAGKEKLEMMDQDQDDPLFNKTEYSVDDWKLMYEKMPENTCSGNSSYLSDYADQILLKEPLRVFLPLCGSSSDLRWLYDRGNTVVGLEAIEKPVRTFFKCNSDLEFTVEDSPSGKVFKTKDNRLLVFVCDITKIEPDVLGKFAAVVDCGAYTAIMPSDRPKYVDLVTQVLESDYRYFVEVCHDAPSDAKGLPHSISFAQVKKDFGSNAKLKFLQTEDISEEWSVESFFQTLILISPKN